MTPEEMVASLRNGNHRVCVDPSTFSVPCALCAERTRAANLIEQLQAELARFYPVEMDCELYSPYDELNQDGRLTVWFRDEKPG